MMKMKIIIKIIKFLINIIKIIFMDKEDKLIYIQKYSNILREL